MSARFALSVIQTSRQSAANHRGFRSDAALDALRSHITAATAAAEPHHLALYNYPSFSGAFAALFARLFHSRLGLPFLALPFSSVEPFTIEDFNPQGVIHTCYLLDFIGPNSFSAQLCRLVPRVIAFDHRKSTAARIPELERISKHLELRINTSKCSARAVCEFFSQRLAEMDLSSGEFVGLLNHEDEERVNNVLRYIEDRDLRRWELPDVMAFDMGLKDECAKLNCITNPHVFEQLLEIDPNDLIGRGKSYISSRHGAARDLIKKAFKIRLGRGVYGECLAIRADGNSDLSHEIALELSRISAAAGLRPIGAAVFMQRGNLKMCLRSTDNVTDTSVIAKVYGGGGNPGSSSFIIRMDEYNHWTSVNSS